MRTKDTFRAHSDLESNLQRHLRNRNFWPACPFCYPHQVHRTQILLTGRHFFLLAPAGQVRKGYLLIMTLKCFDTPAVLRSMDDISPDWLEELDWMRAVVTDFYGAVYHGPATFYEHGRGPRGTSGTSGEPRYRNHPHLCALPGQIVIHEPLREAFDARQVIEFGTVREKAGSPHYVYVHTPHSPVYADPLAYVSRPHGLAVESLSVKALLVRANGWASDPSWRVDPGLQELHEVINEFAHWRSRSIP
jgi:hypothetical protein